MLNETMLRGALYNLSPNAGGDAEYGRGLLVGVVAALQAGGLSFRDALSVASENAPKTIIYNSVPASWIENFAIFNFNRAKYKVNGYDVWERTEGR